MAWVLLEYVRATLFSGFAWNYLGTAFAGMPSFATPARFGGVYLVSALVVLINGVFATMLMRVFAPITGWNLFRSGAAFGWSRRFVQIGETGLPLLFILSCLCVGNKIVRDESAARKLSPTYLRVALIQRNAACCFKSGPRENAYDVFGKLMDSVAAVKPDLVVLAESAMSEFGTVRSFRAHDAIGGFFERTGARYIIAGGDDVVSNRTYNAIALYARKGTSPELIDVYHKQHLVPFGEYIPLDKTFPLLQRLSPIGVSLYSGEPKLFTLTTSNGKKVKVAPLICYEDTDPRLTAKAKSMGADMIVLVTNDSWFSNSSEAEAHAAQAVIRAVEAGVPVVRVGNSGVTGVIRPDGSANWLSDSTGKPIVDERGVMVETVVVQARD
jgi:apolipoprotein N-acyltransferase